ncbi:hypothetical protein HIM_06134 [Hirsutella minnesotensis 3608]|uniref:Uncharacterized protein n=1 Tax=Hirsutella minnesotensis 3608 TaxID=1043627 RepID=A0A0F7ZUA8_9HYPO|nr:hypothetical protein HIM_06134 [Hirsutella minnesotensis 3608]
MAFLEDPRFRQRWNQITHDAEAATENAAAGIWSFQHNYINPCLGSIAGSVEHCTALCLGNPEERLRRRRDRDRTQDTAEYSFDFYDDWYQEEQGGGLLGTWGGEDWDRLLAGTGSARRHAGTETVEQPRRKRGMSYGTRGSKRRSSEEDPTIIPSTQPIGFLSKLPWKLGGTLRYKPSAADLQDRPGKHDNGESEPLLGSDHDSDYGELPMPRKRSGTTGSGDTSDSYRSRGDIFPSDGEGEEDAIPLDDEVTYDMIRKDDRSSGKSGRTRSSKGKRPEYGLAGSRTLSRTTMGSAASLELPVAERTFKSQPSTPEVESASRFDGLVAGERSLQANEMQEVTEDKDASTLALSQATPIAQESADIAMPTLEPKVLVDEAPGDAGHKDGELARGEYKGRARQDADADSRRNNQNSSERRDATFQAARLPRFV